MANEEPVVSAKLLRKAVRSRVPYLEAHHACATELLAPHLAPDACLARDCTMKHIRRLLETDLGLPPKALDAEPHKGAITQLVEEARAHAAVIQLTTDGTLRSCVCCSPQKLRRLKLSRLP